MKTESANTGEASYRPGEGGRTCYAGRVNGDWDKFRDLHMSNEVRAKAELDEDKRRIRHGAWGDNVLFALGCIMMAALIVGIASRLVF